jgi:hypothetical protein
MHQDQTLVRTVAQDRPQEPRSVASPRRTEGRHRRAGRRRGRWRRRLLAYRAVELLQSPAPGAAGSECLLLVHIRKVVGQVVYRACEECAEGVITDVVIDGPFRDSGLGTRALAHLRSRHPGVTWRTTDDHRLTRDLLHRMRIPRTVTGGNCSHIRSAAVAGSAA